MLHVLMAPVAIFIDSIVLEAIFSLVTTESASLAATIVKSAISSFLTSPSLIFELPTLILVIAPVINATLNPLTAVESITLRANSFLSIFAKAIFGAVTELSENLDFTRALSRIFPVTTALSLMAIRFTASSEIFSVVTLWSEISTVWTVAKAM